MKINALRELLLIKAAPHIKDIIQKLDDVRLAILIKAAHDKVHKRPNEIVRAFAKHLSPEDVHTMYDALSHHATHRKAALKAGDKKLAAKHLDKFFNIIHLAQKMNNDAGDDYTSNKMAVHAVDPRPWQEHGPNAYKRGFDMEKTIPAHVDDLYEQAPHEKYSTDVAMHGHNGAYPMEHTRVDHTTPEGEKVSRHIHVEDIDYPKENLASKKYVPHPFDSHPVLIHKNMAEKTLTPIGEGDEPSKYGHTYKQTDSYMDQVQNWVAKHADALDKLDKKHADNMQDENYRKDRLYPRNTVHNPLPEEKKLNYKKAIENRKLTGQKKVSTAPKVSEVSAADLPDEFKHLVGGAAEPEDNATHVDVDSLPDEFKHLVGDVKKSDETDAIFGIQFLIKSNEDFLLDNPELCEHILDRLQKAVGDDDEEDGNFDIAREAGFAPRGGTADSETPEDAPADDSEPAEPSSRGVESIYRQLPKAKADKVDKLVQDGYNLEEAMDLSGTHPHHQMGFDAYKRSGFKPSGEVSDKFLKEHSGEISQYLDKMRRNKLDQAEAGVNSVMYAKRHNLKEHESDTAKGLREKIDALHSSDEYKKASRVDKAKMQDKIVQEHGKAAQDTPKVDVHQTNKDAEKQHKLDLARLLLTGGHGDAGSSIAEAAQHLSAQTDEDAGASGFSFSGGQGTKFIADHPNYVKHKLDQLREESKNDPELKSVFEQHEKKQSTDKTPSVDADAQDNPHLAALLEQAKTDPTIHDIVSAYHDISHIPRPQEGMDLESYKNKQVKTAAPSDKPAGSAASKAPTVIDNFIKRYGPLLNYHSRSVASRYGQLPEGMDHEDLAQAGAHGLLEALSRYSNKGGAKFSSYASPYIKGKMQEHISDNQDHPVLGRYREEAKKYESQFKDKATEDTPVGASPVRTLTPEQVKEMNTQRKKDHNDFVRSPHMSKLTPEQQSRVHHVTAAKNKKV